MGYIKQIALPLLGMATLFSSFLFLSPLVSPLVVFVITSCRQRRRAYSERSAEAPRASRLKSSTEILPVSRRVVR